MRARGNRIGWLAAASWLAWGGAVAVRAGGPETAAPAQVQFFTDLSGQGRLGFFSNQRDELQDERYVSEGGMRLDYALISVGERWAFRLQFDLNAELGTSVADNLPFSPKAMDYSITPFVEYRRSGWLYRLGWNHACQHLIYKDVDEPWYTLEGSNVPPDVFYNRVFFGAGQEVSRPEVLWERLKNGDGAALPRVAGYAEGGVYIRHLFGMDPESLYEENDWRADLLADVKIKLLAGGKWALFAASRTQGLIDGENEWTVRERLRLEAAFGTRGFGSLLYVGGYPVDEHPRDSREGMMEIGGEFSF